MISELFDGSIILDLSPSEELNPIRKTLPLSLKEDVVITRLSSDGQNLYIIYDHIEKQLYTSFDNLENTPIIFGKMEVSFPDASVVGFPFHYSGGATTESKYYLTRDGKPQPNAGIDSFNKSLISPYMNFEIGSTTWRFNLNINQEDSNNGLRNFITMSGFVTDS